MLRQKLARWFDEFGLALRGLLLASKRKEFWPPFVLTFLVFGLLINLLSSGFASFRLIFECLKSGDFVAALNIIKTAFLAIFGVNKIFSDWFLNFILTLFQSILISLVVFVAKHNKKNKLAEENAAESSAIVAGLVVLGSGCPTCGTTLLAPILGTILSGASSAVSLAGKISFALNALAIILAIFVFKKLGFSAYAIIKSEQYKKKKEKQNEQTS
ncbi:hypothetical protein IKF81_02200 [Candidatus Saccharibacteria bacterium]|nr:hypothetical protein [Candidatus Saccharibacteria bacterium]